MNQSGAVLLSLTQVTHRLQVGRTTVRKWVKQGRLSSVIFSKRLVRYRLSEVDAICAKGDS